MEVPEKIPEFLHGSDELVGGQDVFYILPAVHGYGAIRHPSFLARELLDVRDAFVYKCRNLAPLRPYVGGLNAFEVLDVLPDRGVPTGATTDRRTQANSYAPRGIATMVGRLERLVNLEANWDGEGAIAVDPEVAGAALDVLVALGRDKPFLPSVVPTSTSGVQLEWHRSGIDLEVEIGQDRSVILWYWDEQLDNEREERFARVEDAIPHIDGLLTIVEVRG